MNIILKRLEQLKIKCRHNITNLVDELYKIVNQGDCFSVGKDAYTLLSVLEELNKEVERYYGSSK